MTAQEGRGSYRAVLAVIVASTFLGMFAYSGPLGNAVTINNALGADAAGATWILGSMSAGLAATLLAAGVVADRFGRRRVFLSGALVFVIANVACALAGGVAVFVAARILAGAGVTGMIATGLGLVAATDSSPERQGATATWWSVAMGGGIAAGPLLAGAIDLLDGWRWFYVVLAACGLGVWFAGAALLPRGQGSGPYRRLDFVGLLLLTGFLGVLIAAIIEVRTGDRVTILLLFGLAAGLLAALVLSQRYGSRRLVEPALLAHRPFLAATVAAYGTGMGVIAVLAFTASYLVGVLGISTLRAGGFSAIWAVSSIVSALVFARLATRVSGTAQLLLGLLCVSAGLAMLFGVESHHDFPRLQIAMLVSGIGSGVLNTGLARQAIATVPPRDVATGTAANNTARYIGAAIGMSAASVIAAGGAESGWNGVVSMGVAASLISALLMLWLVRPRRARESAAG